MTMLIATPVDKVVTVRFAQMMTTGATPQLIALATVGGGSVVIDG